MFAVTRISTICGTPPAIASANSNTCALLSNGTVKCWGYLVLLSGDSTTPVDMGLTNLTTLAAGAYSACGITSDGAVSCAGDNTYGQFGNGRPLYANAPVVLGTGSFGSVSAVAFGSDFGCALRGTSVYCWGKGYNGELGNSSFNTSSVPVTQSSPISATAIGTGDSHACAALSDTSISCWGENGSGQLGDGTFTDNSTPVANIVSAGSGASKVTCGIAHTCAIVTGGPKCWGENASGQLGNEAFITSTVPVWVSSSIPAISSKIATADRISSGWNHTCARSNAFGSREVICWGNNDSGQLGDGSTTTSNTPVEVPAYTTVAGVTAGGSHSCVVLDSGTAHCWGANYSGQLGNNSTVDSAVPVTVSGISAATAIAGGYDFTCALLSTGGVKCWGNNTVGQLGNGTITNSLTPVTVSNITTATAIAAGVQNACAVLADQTVRCWGYDATFGQLGRNNVTASSAVASTALLSVIDNVQHATTYAQSVTFTLMEPPDAVGTVSFTANGVDIGGCTGLVLTPSTTVFTSVAKTCTTSFYSNGTRTIAATGPSNSLYSTAQIATDSLTITGTPAPPAPTPPAPDPTPAPAPAVDPPPPPPIAAPVAPTPEPTVTAPPSEATNAVTSEIVENARTDGVFIATATVAHAEVTTNPVTNLTEVPVTIVQKETQVQVTVPLNTAVTDLAGAPLASVKLTVVPNKVPISISQPPAGDAGAKESQFASPVMQLGPPGTQFNPPLSIVLPVRQQFLDKKAYDEQKQATCWSCPDGTIDVHTEGEGRCTQLKSWPLAGTTGKLECEVPHFSLVFALTAPPSAQASEGGAGLISSSPPAATAKKSGCSLSPIGNAGPAPSAALASIAALALVARGRRTARRRSRPSEFHEMSDTANGPVIPSPLA